MGSVRVLRVMEYEYDNLESAENDMANWTVPPIGVHSFNSRSRVRSTVMLPSYSPESVTDSNTHGG